MVIIRKMIALVLLVAVVAGCDALPEMSDHPGTRLAMIGESVLTADSLGYNVSVVCNKQDPMAMRVSNDSYAGGGDRTSWPVVRLRIENLKENSEDLLRRDLRNFQHYQERLLYLSNRVEQDLVLRLNAEYIPASFAVLESVPGVLPYVDVLAVFDADALNALTPTDELSLFYTDRAFANGILQFKIDPKSFRCK